jgi:CRISPR-associated protein Cmx8
MAKKATSERSLRSGKVRELPKLVTLNYELAELPSSQHRAGLAGLVLMIEWVKRLPLERQRGILNITRFDETGLTFEMDEQGLHDLFNETYSASTEDDVRNKPLETKEKKIVPPIRTEMVIVKDKNGNSREQTNYIYEITVPRGAFLADPSFDRSFDGKNGVWIKQWRELVWSIFRGVPATRAPYEDRAQGKNCKDVKELWKQINKPMDASVELPSTYFIGAQAVNADNVSFSDLARNQFLLHFWQFIAQVYRPAVYDFDGQRELLGYVLAIPDVGMLKLFCTEFKESMAARGVDLLGYTPREAIVDIAIESGFDFLKRLSERITTRESGPTTPWVLGVDVVHLQREGNNIRLRSTSRIDPSSVDLGQYSAIRNTYWDCRFRIQRLRNLVAARKPFDGFFELIATLPYRSTIQSNVFKHDCREFFSPYLPHSKPDQQESSMAETQPKRKEFREPVSLEEAIYSMIGQYLSRKLESKYDIKWDSCVSPEQKEDYGRKKQKLATDAFLQIRSRTHNQDFVSFFTSTICSVSHFLPEGAYKVVADSLLNRPEDVRNLTLLALSARS